MWNVLGNVGGKILAPLFQLVMARLLLPKDFGMFSILMAVVAIYDIVKDLGFTDSIIVCRTRQATKVQFTMQLAISVVMFIFSIPLSSYLAIFYGDHRYLTALPMMTTIFFLKSVIDPITTSLLRMQQYRTLALRQILFPFVFGAVGTLLAIRGFGVYALIYSTMAAYALVSMIFAIKHRDAIGYQWDWTEIRHHFQLGKHMLVQRSSGYLVHQGDSFFIGKNLGMTGLGLYRTALQLVMFIPGCVIGQVQQVLFTEMAEHQHMREYIAQKYDRFIWYSGLFLVLYAASVHALSSIIVPAMMGDQWIWLVPFLQLLGPVMISAYLTVLSVDLSKILGFSSVYTHYAVIRSVVTIVLVFVASFFSLKIAVFTWGFCGLAAGVVNEYLLLRSQDVIGIRASKICFMLLAWLWFFLVAFGGYFTSFHLWLLI